MRVVSFDAFRTLRLPSVTYIKPTHFHQKLSLIESADWVLFPEYWQVNSLHYAMHKKIFPSLASYHLGHNKVEMTRAFQTLCPANVPYTLILANTEQNRESVLEQLDFPFVAKEIKNSRGNGVFLIENHADWQRYCQQNEVLYAQEYLPIQQDMRLVVIGRKVVAGYWRRQPEGGFHNNVAKGAEISFDPIPDAAIELVTQVAQHLNINHAGFDVAQVGNHFYLFEFNRLFGNQGLVEQGVRLDLAIWEYLLAEQDPPSLPPLGQHPQAV